MEVKKMQKKPVFLIVAILFILIFIAAVFAMLSSLTDSRMETPAGIDPGTSYTASGPVNTKTVTVISVSHQSGNDTIRLFGRADFPPGSAILYEVWPKNAVAPKKTTEEISGVSGRTLAYSRNESVVWSVDVDTGSWKNGEYIVNAWPEQSDPLFGDRKKFSLPLVDTIGTGAGKDAGNGEIILNEVIPSNVNSVPGSLPPYPTPVVAASAQPTSAIAAPSAGSPQDPGSPCNISEAGSRALVPVDTSVPIRDPIPGIRYFFDRDETGRTIELAKGEIVEINLGFAPGLAMRWVVPVSGCGIELVNDGVWYTGGDFWNNTGFYRARYRAVSPGTSVIDGKLVFKPEEAGDLRFNLTVIVK